MRFVILGLLALASSGCNDDACVAACKRVAQCKENKNLGSEPLPGERAPPADRRCMDRCKTKPQAWKQCESKQRTCRDLRGCLGANFDD